MSFEVEIQLAGLLRLVREKQLIQAQAVLGEIIAQSPDVTAQWLVLVRLLLLDPVRWNQEIQQSLGQLGCAPLSAFRQAIGVLDEAERGGEDRRMDVRMRLEALLVVLERYREAGISSGSRSFGVRWLDQVQARQAQVRLTAPLRVVARLEALANGIKPGHFGKRLSTDRVISRLEGLRQAMVR